MTNCQNQQSEQISILPNSLLVSVVINNYNYERFLRDAIKSALNQSYSHVELIVVDDGSTDDSRTIISQYNDRLIPVFKQNGGQASALNAGFQLSRGTIIIFLDADDYLFPGAIEQIVQEWKPGLAKLHYRLAVVDRSGRKRGIHPNRRQKLAREKVLDSLLQSGRYFTPVTSGNAFSRSTLEQVMPMPEEEFRLAADGYLNVLSPLYGEIEAIEVPLGAYRLHGDNLWAMTSQDINKIQKMISHDFVRYKFLQSAAKARGYSTPINFWQRDYIHIKHRLLLKILDTSASGSEIDLMGKAIIALYSDQNSSFLYKLNYLLNLLREIAQAYLRRLLRQ